MYGIRRIRRICLVKNMFWDSMFLEFMISALRGSGQIGLAIDIGEAMNPPVFLHVVDEPALEIIITPIISSPRCVNHTGK